jgi:altronate dehydratase
MVQMGTGAMDTAAPLTQNPRNQTASGMSMMQSAFIKRSKRTMQNVDRQLLTPLIKRIAYLYMQFDSDRFPPFDPVFKVSATMGIAAREYEIQQLTQMMQIIPPDHPAFSVIIKGLVENTSLSNKQQLQEAITQSQQPDPAQQKQQQISMQTMEEELKKLQAEIDEIRSKTVKNLSDAQETSTRPTIEAAKIAQQGKQKVSEK